MQIKIKSTVKSRRITAIPRLTFMFFIFVSFSYEIKLKFPYERETNRASECLNCPTCLPLQKKFQVYVQACMHVQIRVWLVYVPVLGMCVRVRAYWQKIVIEVRVCTMVSKRGDGLNRNQITWFLHLSCLTFVFVLFQFRLRLRGIFFLFKPFKNLIFWNFFVVVMCVVVGNNP